MTFHSFITCVTCMFVCDYPLCVITSHAAVFFIEPFADSGLIFCATISWWSHGPLCKALPDAIHTYLICPGHVSSFNFRQYGCMGPFCSAPVKLSGILHEVSLVVEHVCADLGVGFF